MINPVRTKVAHVIDGSVIAYGTPASIFTHTSFPATMAEEQLARDFNLHPIKQRTPGAFQKSVPADPYLYQGDVYDNHVVEMSVAERKTAMRRELQRKFVEARDKGVIVNGAKIQTTHNAQQELEALVGKLARDGGSQNIRTREGVTITADFDTATLLRNSVANYISNVWANDATLGEAIDNATTIEQLAAIDLSAGW